MSARNTAVSVILMQLTVQVIICPQSVTICGVTGSIPTEALAQAVPVLSQAVPAKRVLPSRFIIVVNRHLCFTFVQHAPVTV